MNVELGVDVDGTGGSTFSGLSSSSSDMNSTGEYLRQVCKNIIKCQNRIIILKKYQCLLICKQ